MKIKNLFYLALVASVAFVSCSKDDADIPTPDPTPDPSPSIKYPAGSIVWAKDTTVILTDHFLVDKNKSLYVEEGATIIANNIDKKPEIVVLGNMYCMGTAENPVLFTVADGLKTDRFSRNWGGIICGYDSKEVLLDHVIVEYAGAQTTTESLSYMKGLFKSETGEGVPAFHFCNTKGSFVITNSIFRNNAEDQIYITGGKSIVSNNQFITSGFDGGEAINYKAGCLADIAYNLIYDANTNGLKLSNAGMDVDMEPSHLICYNNTLLNTGWRRPSMKGGSIWLETNIMVELYNNMIYDCRFGLKHKTAEEEDPNSVITPNYYFASTQAGVNQMKADAENGNINGVNDIMSATPGDKKPLFVNFTQQSDININAGGNVAGAPIAYNEKWDFHLQAASPALKGGKTNFTRHFATKGIEMTGLKDIVENETFTSPAPAAYFGVYGAK